MFEDYKEKYNMTHLTLVVSSGDRPGDFDGSPHKIPGNAQDITLRWRGDYAPVRMYNHLMEYLMMEWPYRAGIDNTPQPTAPDKHGNVHIHLDLGMVLPAGQSMPFFFIEEDQRFIKQIFPGEFGGIAA